MTHTVPSGKSPRRNLGNPKSLGPSETLKQYQSGLRDICKLHRLYRFVLIQIEKFLNKSNLEEFGFEETQIIETYSRASTEN